MPPRLPLRISPICFYIGIPCQYVSTWALKVKTINGFTTLSYVLWFSSCDTGPSSQSTTLQSVESASNDIQFVQVAVLRLFICFIYWIGAGTILVTISTCQWVGMKLSQHPDSYPLSSEYCLSGCMLSGWVDILLHAKEEIATSIEVVNSVHVSQTAGNLKLYRNCGHLPFYT